MSFGRALALIVIGGLGLRLAYALLLVGEDPLLGDGLQFHNLANLNADGHFFVQDRLFLGTGVERPTADKPPLYPLLLTVPSLVGGRSAGWHHVAGCLCGAGTIALVGLLGRRVAGSRTGLIAAGLAAASPLLIATDGSLRSESPYALLIAACLLAAVRLREAPSTRAALVLGALIGLAALTRGEAVLLLGLLALPAALAAGTDPRPARARPSALRLTAVAAAACLLVLAPWVVRSSLALDAPVLISTNVGGLVAGANCDETYSGPLLGQWSFNCLRPPRSNDEADVSAALREDGLDYAREHLDRLPVVLLARLGRSFDVWRPRQSAQLMRFYEGRSQRVAQASIAWFWLLVPAAAVGAALLRRRGGPVGLLVAPVVLVAIVSLTAYGWTRFRVAAEPGLLVLAAVAADQLLARRGVLTPRAAVPD